MRKKDKTTKKPKEDDQGGAGPWFNSQWLTGDFISDFEALQELKNNNMINI